MKLIEGVDQMNKYDHNVVLKWMFDEVEFFSFSVFLQQLLELEISLYSWLTYGFVRIQEVMRTSYTSYYSTEGLIKINYLSLNFKVP